MIEMVRVLVVQRGRKNISSLLPLQGILTFQLTQVTCFCYRESRGHNTMRCAILDLELLRQWLLRTAILSFEIQVWYHKSSASSKVFLLPHDRSRPLLLNS